MPSLRPAALLAALFALALPAAAQAGDPIMPLTDVQPGMHCTGYTVVRGTDIASFNVDVIDVVTAGVADIDAKILVRASGPNVDGTGVAEGFSGSPVYCPGADGTPRVIGAIAESTGDYGNYVVLVTPIEQMLGEPVDVPASAKPMPAAVASRARPLAVPLSYSGLDGPVASALQAAGRRAGRTLYTAPAAPRTAFPVQTLQPGSSVAVSLSSGDVEAGGVGTVTYVDNGNVWAFGHPLDGAGRRSLLLQDAYVYTVIGSPLDTQDMTPYKLAAPGHDLGTLTDDAADAVVGRLGGLPATYPVHVTGTDLDSGHVVYENLQIADETPIGLPTGVSGLTEVVPEAVAETTWKVLRGSPSQQSGSMCVRVTIQEAPKPLRFCNRYLGGSPDSPGAPMAADVMSAGGLLDGYDLSTVHVKRVDVDLKLRRELDEAYLLHAQAPVVVHRGHSAVVRLLLQHVRGTRFVRTVHVHVPSYLPKGLYLLRLAGPSGGGGDGSLMDVFLQALMGGPGGGGGSSHGPKTLNALERDFAQLHRKDGVTARFMRPGEGSTDPVVVYQDDNLWISGTARVPLIVRR